MLSLIEKSKLLLRANKSTVTVVNRTGNRMVLKQFLDEFAISLCPTSSSFIVTVVTILCSWLYRAAIVFGTRPCNQNGYDVSSVYEMRYYVVK